MTGFLNLDINIEAAIIIAGKAGNIYLNTVPSNNTKGKKNQAFYESHLKTIISSVNLKNKEKAVSIS